MQYASTFLGELWGNKDPDRGHILIWDAEYVAGENRLKNSKSSWANTAGVAEKIISERAKVTPAREIYVGCGLRDEPLGSTKRGGIKTIVGVPGLWAEVDFGQGKVKKYPDNEEEALALVGEMRLKPTLIIHSGHGFHLWWLFKDIWYLDSDEERQQFVELIRDWQGTLCAHAAVNGKSIDSTFDLARVLRVPGTTNHKRIDLPVRVEIYKHNPDNRYAEDDFQEFITVRGVDVEEIGNAGGPVSLSENANPPVEKLDRLKKASAKFRASWERRRTDFSDQSASTYCISLAYYALAAGWSDQEITDLLVSWRRKYNEPLKLNRPAWYQTTINKARENLKKNRESEEAISKLSAKDISLDKEEILELTSKLLNGEKILEFVQHGEEEAQYRFDLDSGKIVELGTTKVLCSIDLMRQKLLGKTGRVIPAHVTRQAWYVVLDRLMSIRKIINPDEGDRVQQLLDWLMDYCLATNMPDDFGEEESIYSAIYEGRPYLRHQSSAWWINAEHFRQWLKLQKIISLTPGVLASTFHLASFRRQRTKTPIDRRYWVGDAQRYSKVLEDIERRKHRH